MFQLNIPDILSLESRDKWAKFSGDYNKIHFDFEWAKKLGLDEIVAHGMLGMLPLKQSIFTHALSLNTENKAVKLFISLKTPLPIDTKFNIVTKKTDKSILKFTLKSNDNDIYYYSGFCKFLEKNNSLEYQEDNVDIIDINDVGLIIKSFKNEFSFVEYLWIAIDAIIFSSILKKIHDQSKERNSPYMIIQTMHEINIENKISKVSINSFLKDINIPNIRYRLTYENPISGVGYDHITACVYVWLENDLILIIEVGLMKKYI